METDRDGLIDLRGTGVQIAVSPELIVRAVALCNAVLNGATKRGWMVKAGASPGAHLRVSITGEEMDFIVEEKTEPNPWSSRRPRRAASTASDIPMAPHLLAAGMELPAVSERLGHSSVYVTATVYSHRIKGRDEGSATVGGISAQK